MKRLFFNAIIAVSALLAGCRPAPLTNGRETVYVSIMPLRTLVNDILGDDFDIEVLVPSGASPETFEPSARQYVALNNASLIFNVGLIDFETSLLKKVENHTKIIDLSRGIVPIAGSCAHGHKHDKADGDLHPHGADLPGNSGLQGVDPHVWTSPKALQRMAANAYDAIRTRWPNSAKYEANYRRLQRELQALDIRTGARIDSSGVKSFIVYHPALTYYARDYGLEQIAIEADGKEPSARRLAHIIRRARKEKIRKILYQSQFPASAVEIIASDIDGKGIPFDPLREDPIAGIDEITRIITEQ